MWKSVLPITLVAAMFVANEAVADGFEDSSFEGSGSPTPPAPPNVAGGFEDGSFETDDNNTTTNDVVLPPPPPPPEDQVNDIVPPPPPPPPPPPENDTPGPKVQLDPQITAFETRDFGVPPQRELRSTQLHAPTPTSVPGGQLVTTQALANAMNDGVQLILIDVLGGTYSIPGAYSAPPLASPGSFNDRTQQQAGIWLKQITNGNAEMPIVLYCSDPMCWLSYNATLRTVAAGFTNVYWYRGGLQAWEMAGFNLSPSGF